MSKNLYRLFPSTLLDLPLWLRFALLRQAVCTGLLHRHRLLNFEQKLDLCLSFCAAVGIQRCMVCAVHVVVKMNLETQAPTRLFLLFICTCFGLLQERAVTAGRVAVNAYFQSEV